MIDPQRARTIAREMLEVYGLTESSRIVFNDTAMMVSDAYKHITKSAPLSSSDLKAYQKMFTRKDDQDAITIEDLERTAVKYLCGQDKLQSLHSYKPRTRELLGRARKVFAGYDREACGVLPDDDMKKVWADVNRDLSLSIRVEEPRGELITLGKFEEQLARELERS